MPNFVENQNLRVREDNYKIKETIEDNYLFLEQDFEKKVQFNEQERQVKEKVL